MNSCSIDIYDGAFSVIFDIFCFSELVDSTL